MTGARHCGDELVELYFYDELPAGERRAMDAHLRDCESCSRSLADLRAIEAALESRSGARPEDGWTAFMSRLDARLDCEIHGAAAARGPRAPRFLRLAAALALIAGGAAGGWMLLRVAPANSSPPAARTARVDGVLNGASDAGLQRARVVLAGLAQKDDGEEWSLEKRMAGTLLPEVSLIRQAAVARGRDDLADILMDVETLLLQASYAEDDDAETLARLRGMIDRRDVLMRLSLAGG